MRLLVVEDEKKVASFIRKGLEEEGYAVDLVSDGKTGLIMGLDGIHDLIILDINLPKMDGIDCIKIDATELPCSEIEIPINRQNIAR